jgi:transposase-like protein
MLFKRKIKKMMGLHAPHLESYLKEYMWRRRNFGKNYFSAIWSTIREQYPV